MPVATVDQLLGLLLLNAIAGIVIFVALVRIVSTPAGLWAHGRLSKAAWIIATIWFIPTAGGLAFPVAAAAAIWHTGRLARQGLPAPRPEPLPFAEGAEETGTAAARAGDEASQGSAGSES